MGRGGRSGSGGWACGTLADPAPGASQTGEGSEHTDGERGKWRRAARACSRLLVTLSTIPLDRFAVRTLLASAVNPTLSPPSAPDHRTSPISGSSSPGNTSTAVDFPEPFPLTSAVTSPLRIRTLTSRSAGELAPRVGGGHALQGLSRAGPALDRRRPEPSHRIRRGHGRPVGCWGREGRSTPEDLAHSSPYPTRCASRT